MKNILSVSIFLFVSVFQLIAGDGAYRLLIGTYTNTKVSEGIYSYAIDVEKGVFKPIQVAKELVNPSFLALSTDKKYVYAISESGTESKAGAFTFDAGKGSFKFLNSSLTEGKGPCHIAVTDKHIVTANYSGGSLSVFRINTDGSLSDLIQLIQHTGSSIHPQRQTKPYAHQVVFTPDHKFLLSCDLGTDLVMVYKYDRKSEHQPLVVYDSVQVKAGSGPRHLTISKNGKFAYLIQEIDGTVSVMNLKNGKLKIIQETSVVIKSDIETGAADIHLSPDGKFLYASNRGTANDITCFAVEKTGKLRFIQQISSGGVGPRNFALTPDGKYLFIGNQQTDNIVVFKRDIKTGKLTDIDKSFKIGAPVCLLFY
ncbi:MAG: lactonase family protein [Paludibacter sp.]|nr:lactonase family protein [Paludibacter sp.]MDD4427715.1 lactonase family protein [Paludibacter sp.]